MEKKKWTKPECRKTRLVPQEALASGCKNKVGGGPGYVLCHGGGQGACTGQLVS